MINGVAARLHILDNFLECPSYLNWTQIMWTTLCRQVSLDQQDQVPFHFFDSVYSSRLENKEIVYEKARVKDREKRKARNPEQIALDREKERVKYQKRIKREKAKAPL